MRLYHGDCLEVMRSLPDASVDAVVTDPPYGLSFMNKGWDKGVPGVAYWQEALRVLKPGGHLLSFGGSRTYHRMAAAIEDAGFEIRDQIMWLYGSGFPKSHNVSNAIDKAAGVERSVIGTRPGGASNKAGETLFSDDAYSWSKDIEVTAPATDAARQWEGWGTALKPAHEPIVVARKPLIGTVADNVLAHGTGALNIDGCRVEHVTIGDGSNLALNPHLRTHINGGNGGHIIAHEEERRVVVPHQQGRWPANVMHDGSDEVLAAFAEFGDRPSTRIEKPSQCNTEGNTSFDTMRGNRPARGYADKGSAARFFYCAKASKKDRDEGLEQFPARVSSVGNLDAAGRDPENPANYKGGSQRRVEAGLPPTEPRKNTHPTVKPTSLMRYLCRLVTPPGGIVLDPFMGSGSTLKAAALEGFDGIGVELDASYFAIAQARIAREQNNEDEADGQ